MNQKLEQPSMSVRAGLLARPLPGLRRGSWDLVSKVINKVTILKITYNPN